MSFGNYKATSGDEHGEVLCWASNELGEQSRPCVFHVVPIHGCVCSAHWAKPLSAEDLAVRAECVRAIEIAIDDCRFYGGSTVLVVPAVVNKDVSYRQAWDRSRVEIARVLPTAADAGVAIAFENVWNNFLLSPLEAAAYVDSFESDAVGWYMDIGNIVAYGWPEHWIEALGPRILKVDVKEYSRKKLNDEGRWAGFGVPIGEGDCDWPAVMRALEDVGFRGWLTAEVGGGGRERLADIGARMDRIVAAAPSNADD